MVFCHFPWLKDIIFFRIAFFNTQGELLPEKSALEIFDLRQDDTRGQLCRRTPSPWLHKYWRV